ncbi:MAG: PAS domain S-box protein, partial [Burkholderiales bacterium]|nr:PAS domain S-box protein [Burkholderiales bacterium]
LQLTNIRLSEVSVLLNASIGPSMAQQDYATINDVFRVSRRKEGIVYFLLFDQRHRLIASDGWADKTAQTINDIHITADDERLDARIPIMLAGQQYGELLFGVSTRFIQDARNKLLRESIAIASAEVILSFFFIALLGTWLTRNLKYLEVSANAISHGHYDTKVAHIGADEIGVVGRALNLLSDRLAHEIDALKRSEQQQRETASRLQSVFEAVPDYLTLSRFDDGMIVYANDGFEKITGYSKQEAMGKTSLEMHIWPDPETRKIWTGMMLETGSVSNFQTDIQQRNGNINKTLLSAATLYIDGVKHIVAICKDMTERIESEIRVENARRALQDVLDAASEVAIIATDTDGVVTMFNRGAEKMLGYRADECVGKMFPAVFHDRNEMLQRSRELSEQLGRPILGIEIFTAVALLNGSETRNWIYVHKNGERFHVSLGVTTVKDVHGSVTGYLGVARNITPEIEAQQALGRLNDELESRVLQRTAELEQANHDLASAMEHLQLAQTELIRSEKLRALGNIVAVVAHELNTPIGNCLTVASTLRDKSVEIHKAFDDGALKRSNLTTYLDDTRQGMEILLRGLNRSSELVTNFKQVAVDQVTDQRRQFDLLHVINDVVALLTPMLRKTGYTLEVDIPEPISMDSYPGPLEQVVTNLINNAVAHAFDGKEFGVMRLYATMSAPDSVRIEFSDDGIGIEDEQLSRIFDPFYTTKLGRGGTGLGLNIVHNIVTKMLGGHLDVKSFYGKGTCFIVDLPQSAPRTTPQNASAML